MDTDAANRIACLEQQVAQLSQLLSRHLARSPNSNEEVEDHHSECSLIPDVRVKTKEQQHPQNEILAVNLEGNVHMDGYDEAIELGIDRHLGSRFTPEVKHCSDYVDSQLQDSISEHGKCFTAGEAKTEKLFDNANKAKREKFRVEQEHVITDEPTPSPPMIGPYGGTSSRTKRRLPSNDGSHRKLRRKRYAKPYFK